jgi:hypothetical protein
MSVADPEQIVQGAPLRVAAALMSIGLLMSALVSPESLRILLSSAGLLGIAGLRFSAAREGWARRGSAWQ